MGSNGGALHGKIIIPHTHETADIQSNKEAREAVASMEAKGVDIHVFRVKPWVFQIKLAEDQDPT